MIGRMCAQLCIFLTEQPGIDVVGEIDNARYLLHHVELVQPDIVLLDWDLPDLLAVDLLAALCTRAAQVKVIALSSRIEAREEALTAGVASFVSKGETAERLLAALHVFAHE